MDHYRSGNLSPENPFSLLYSYDEMNSSNESIPIKDLNWNDSQGEAAVKVEPLSQQSLPVADLNWEDSQDDFDSKIERFSQQSLPIGDLNWEDTKGEDTDELVPPHVEEEPFSPRSAEARKSAPGCREDSQAADDKYFSPVQEHDRDSDEGHSDYARSSVSLGSSDDSFGYSLSPHHGRSAGKITPRQRSRRHHPYQTVDNRKRANGQAGQSPASPLSVLTPVAEHNKACSRHNRAVKGRLIPHMVNEHPEAEVSASRLSPAMAAKCIAGVDAAIRNEKKKKGKFTYEIMCVFCNTNFDQPMAAWINHIRTHTGEHAFRCAKCNRIYNQSNGHKSCRNQVWDLQPSKEEKTEYQIEFDGQILHASLCTLCFYVRLDARNIEMEKHLKDHHDGRKVDQRIGIIKLPPKEIAVPVAKQTHRIAEELMGRCRDGNVDSLFCVFCEKRQNIMGQDRDAWISHITQHTGEYEFKCNGCNKKFLRGRSCGCPNRDMIQVQNFDIEDDRLPAHACFLCNYVQLDQDRVISHIAQSHPDVEGIESMYMDEIVLLNLAP